MKKNKFLIAVLIFNLLLLSYDYSRADCYSQKAEELISEIANPNPAVSKIHHLMNEISSYEVKDDELSLISISSEDEEILENLAQNVSSSTPSTTFYPVPQLCDRCHLPQGTYPVTGYSSARNNPTAIEIRNKERFRRIEEVGDAFESGGRQPYYCGTVEMPLDEIYRRLNGNDCTLTANTAYEDSKEIIGAKRYYDFKGKNLLTKLNITPPLCAANPLLAIATICLALPERQKHIRIFPTGENGVYEISSHDEPSIFHPLQHLHYTSATVSDNYDEIKKIFPEMKGKPERGTWQDEGKINRVLREIGGRIRSLFRI